MNTDEISLGRIYRERNIKTLYFDRKTPDEVIAMMEEVKKTSKDRGYDDVIIYAGAEEYDGGISAYIGAKCMSLETDGEYRERIKRMLLVLERNKKLWEEKTDFYNGTGKDCWSDKVETYKKVLDSI